MKKSFYIKVLFLFSIGIGSCLSPKENNVEQILSLVFNTQIGNEEHIGGNWPIMPEPPKYEELEKYSTLREAEKDLNSKDWVSYFENAEKFDERVRGWEDRKKKLNRKIIFFNKAKINDEYKIWISETLRKDSVDLQFLEESTVWDKSDIRNGSVYELVNYSEVRNVSLDSIYIGSVTFSKIGINKKKNRAILYYEWFCGDLCGWGNIAIIKKVEGEWEMEEIINIWIS